MKNIYFFSSNLNQGSTRLRGYQIKTVLEKKIPNKIRVCTPDSNVKNAIIIWIGPHRHKYRIDKSNINILDVVDKYICSKKVCENTLKQYQGIIVNSNKMKEYFIQKLKCSKHITVIPHHWDPRFETTQTDAPKLRFGYMGSIKSLLKDPNFVNFRYFGKKYPIDFFDTEIGRSVTDKITSNINYPIKFSKNNIPKKVSFNCDVSIRPNGSDVYRFKTTAKVATAAALRHNIITTDDWAVRDVLPDDYPFLMKEASKNNIENMFQTIINDYHGEAILWKKAQSMMEEVREKLSIQKVVLSYVSLIHKFA